MNLMLSTQGANYLKRSFTSAAAVQKCSVIFCGNFSIVEINFEHSLMFFAELDKPYCYSFFLSAVFELS